MDSPSPGIDFAIIGHQDSWQNIKALVNGLRSSGQEQLPVEKIRDIFSFIPPADLFRIKVTSKTGAEINGVYIETFIDPDKLDIPFIRPNIGKVMKAVTHAHKMGAGIVALGGFTSIVLEGNLDLFPPGRTKFTTGNTLTAVYIVKGLEKAACDHGISLSQSNVLIIGATGDIGTACVNYLKNKVGKLLLCARNPHRLEKLAIGLMQENTPVEYSVCVQDLVPQADAIICVASSTGIQLDNCKTNVLICDAGYPKNLETKTETEKGLHLYHGGMGQVNYGYHFIPDYSRYMYSYPALHIAHGCILEAIVLAFESKIESYSAGKGQITLRKMEEIYAMSVKHGINLAPLYNSKGLLEQPVSVTT